MSRLFPNNIQTDILLVRSPELQMCILYKISYIDVKEISLEISFLDVHLCVVEYFGVYNIGIRSPDWILAQTAGG